MSAHRLTVWWDGRIAGCLAQDQHGDLSFAYDAGWLDSADARALSRSLPLQPDIRSSRLSALLRRTAARSGPAR